MNYDTVIVELLSRVQALEAQVDSLNQKCGCPSRSSTGEIEMNTNKKITTTDIKNYILELKHKARQSGKKSITLIARGISSDLQLKQRYPMICNAMRQAMNESDEIVSSPASGYSSTLEIKYYLYSM